MHVQSYTGISENNNNVNNISNSKQLVNTYMEVLKDDAVMNAVGNKLSNQFDETVLCRIITLLIMVKSHQHLSKAVLRFPL